jgi:hypothetical protein
MTPLKLAAAGAFYYKRVPDIRHKAWRSFCALLPLKRET